MDDLEGAKVKMDSFVVAAQPTDFALYENYPNPLNPCTDIKYQIPISVPTTLKVYNILGQEVRTLVDGVREPGFYTVTWDGRDCFCNDASSGVYFCRIEAGDFIQRKKMLLLK